MALAVAALQKGRTGRAMDLLTITLVLSSMFLVFKFFEWKAKFSHGIFPGLDHFVELAHGEKLFFTLYFIMTGLHGVHVLIGISVMGIVLDRIRRGRVGARNYQILEYTGLYWHLVDLIWIFLLPLFYLTN